ncbi:uncharacterized protein [Leptinotarsa decemlineata]|uniref:uncharacterized protein n=1 Tax=Leptinotarsa decemlineata TaxID=7539 RepID=UPI003D3044B6
MQTRAQHARAQLANVTTVQQREVTPFDQIFENSDTFNRLSAISTEMQQIPQESVFRGHSIPRTPAEMASLRLSSARRLSFEQEDVSPSTVVAERQNLGTFGTSVSRLDRTELSQRTQSSNRVNTPAFQSVLNRIRDSKTPKTTNIHNLFEENEEAEDRPQSAPQLEYRTERQRNVEYYMPRLAQSECRDTTQIPPRMRAVPVQMPRWQRQEVFPTYLETPRVEIHRVYSHPVLHETQYTTPLLTTNKSDCSRRNGQEVQNLGRREVRSGRLDLDLDRRRALNVERLSETQGVSEARETSSDRRRALNVEREWRFGLEDANLGRRRALNVEEERGQTNEEVVQRQALRRLQGQTLSGLVGEWVEPRAGASLCSEKCTSDGPAELGGGGSQGGVSKQFGAWGDPHGGTGVPHHQEFDHVPVSRRVELRQAQDQPHVALGQSLGPEIPGTQVREARWPLRRPEYAEADVGAHAHATASTRTIKRGHGAQRKGLEHEDVPREVRRPTRTQEQSTMVRQRVVSDPGLAKNYLAPVFEYQHWASADDGREVHNVEFLKQAEFSSGRRCETIEGGVQEVQPSRISAHTLVLPSVEELEAQSETMEAEKPKDRMEELFTRLVTVLEKRQEPQREAESDSQNGKKIRIPPPTFSGLDHEDPTEFCRKAEEQLQDLHPSVWVNTAAQWLKGAAAAWYGPYKNMTLDWAFFTNRLQERFDNELLVSSLESSLYGVDQRKGEPVTNFILHKLGLARRLYPEMPEKRIVQLSLNRMCAEVKVHLQLHTFTSVEELTQKAVAVESLLRGSNSSNNASQGAIRRTHHEDRGPRRGNEGMNKGKEGQREDQPKSFHREDRGPRRDNGGHGDKGGCRMEPPKQFHQRQEPIGASHSQKSEARPQEKNQGYPSRQESARGVVTSDGRYQKRNEAPARGRVAYTPKCYNCGGPHYSNDCPKPKQAKMQTTNSNGRSYQSKAKPDGHTVARVVEATKPRDHSNEKKSDDKEKKQQPSGNASGSFKRAPEGGPPTKGRQ